ncbi:hypothetical protein GWK10_17045 [Spongiivirga citrea]|uniref:Beta-carotene 15,15'-monooxygenase n=1 Tax=Spongiivirga citrea TaxID=1481457 RepID=A0A6M0CS70_9FLAO|nr:hypothetical protein [Spongiivirga citrea]
MLVFIGLGHLSYNIFLLDTLVTPQIILQWTVGLLALLFAIFLIDFISKRNSLTKQNSYVILLFLLFIALFPSIFLDWRVILSNILIILAIRRTISIRSLSDVKRRLFDATFWIVLATLIYFWSILFLLLVFITILLYVSEDYKNWLVPPLTVLLTSFLIFTILFLSNNLELIDTLLGNRKNFDFSPYLSNLNITIGLAFLVLLFTASLLVYLKQQRKKTYQIQNSIFLILVSFTIAIMIALVAPDKNGSELIFMIFPLAVFVTNYLENLKRIWLQEGILWLMVILPIVLLVL